MNRPLLHVLADLSAPTLTVELAERCLRSLEGANDDPKSFARVRILLRPDLAIDTERYAPLSWQFERERGCIEATNLSFAAAARDGADLLVLNAATAPDARSLNALRDALCRDPFFAFAEPRVSSFGAKLIRKLDLELGDPEIASIPKSVIDSLPDSYVVPDHLGAAVLVRANVARDFAPLDESFETLASSLRELIARARRTGFRCIVSNRASVEELLESAPPTSASQRDLQILSACCPEVSTMQQLWEGLELHAHESLLGRAASFSSELSRTLLVDLSDVGPIHNGTSEASLGLLSGFQACGGRWNISLLVAPETSEYHQLATRFPGFGQEWPEPKHRFTAVFRPVQPWSLAWLGRLHRMALFNFVMMFDTILNEIHEGAPHGLGKVWSQLARSADGILYISEFTRQRFRNRFPLAACVEEHVARLSLAPGDYCAQGASASSGDYLYVVGNGYPHKWMPQTVADLSSAFPFQQLRTLGYYDPSVPNLVGLPSGHATQADVEALYANSRAIIYPSQYEGFGFPVVRGLSYGKTVIARKSDLLSELAAHYRGPGRLLEYESREELVELAGRVLHGHPVEAMALGSALPELEGPQSWSDVASGVLDFIDDRTLKPDSSNWIKRQETIEAMELYGVMHGG